MERKATRAAPSTKCSMARLSSKALVIFVVRHLRAGNARCQYSPQSSTSRPRQGGARPTEPRARTNATQLSPGARQNRSVCSKSRVHADQSPGDTHRHTHKYMRSGLCTREVGRSRSKAPQPPICQSPPTREHVQAGHGTPQRRSFQRKQIFSLR